MVNGGLEDLEVSTIPVLVLQEQILFYR